MLYNEAIPNKEVNNMARKKKSGKQDKALQALILITAILNLVKSLIDLIGKLIE